MNSQENSQKLEPGARGGDEIFSEWGAVGRGARSAGDRGRAEEACAPGKPPEQEALVQVVAELL